MPRLSDEDKAISSWLTQVSQAASAFEKRWTLKSLRRVSADLAQRLAEQVSLFDQATITGSAHEVEEHGAATCRGYQAAVRAMEAAQEPDDAYVLGWDAKTGFRVAIGHQRAAAERVAEVEGDQVVWVTPDEVAAIMAAAENLKPLMAIKRMFPGSEVIDRFPDHSAKGDSEAA
jgi:hypothetical protein